MIRWRILDESIFDITNIDFIGFLKNIRSELFGMTETLKNSIDITKSNRHDTQQTFEMNLPGVSTIFQTVEKRNVL